MEKVKLSEDVVQVTVVGVDGVAVEMILHNRDAGILVEQTEKGDAERTWYCPKCKRTFTTPL